MEIVVPSIIEVIDRSRPPRELTAEQAVEWVALVERMSADWFPRETHGMLTQYCRHVVAVRRVAQLIAKAEKAKTFDLERDEV